MPPAPPPVLPPAAKRRQQRRPFKPSRRRRLGMGFWVTILLLLLLASYAGVLELSRPHVSGDTLRLDVFLDDVSKGTIKDARLLDVDGYVVGSYVRPNGTTATYNTPYLKTTGLTELELALTSANVPTSVDQQNDKRVAQYGAQLLPPLMMVVLFAYLLLSYRSHSGVFAIRSGARRGSTQRRKVTFADVAGQAEAVTEMRDIGHFLADPSSYIALGAEIPRGVLLFGPPGCGKTLLARALASEVGANYFSISGSDFTEMYVGVGAARVRDLFREAREHAPAIVFIDELDSVGRRRGGGTQRQEASNPEQEQALNQILAEMDGFSSTTGIVVIGATNRPNVLDQALLRPGRFDRSIGLEQPSEAARLEILNVHARTRRLDPTVDLRDIARRGVALSGADLANVVNEAALLAARLRRPAIIQKDFSDALERVLGAPARQRRLSMRDRAYARNWGSNKVTFADVAGVDSAIAELSEFRDFLTEPERFTAAGARVARGVLLVGPPGCGKTLLARAVAGETNAAFFSVAASEFVEVFVGEGAGRVRDLFAEARSSAPSIVFLDEIDAIGGHRFGQSGYQEFESTLNQLLVEMDGFDPKTGVVVIGATNRPETLDAALLRAGRFDRQVTIELPDREGRRRILELYLRNKNCAPGVDAELLAGITQGLSGADLANLVNEAALLQARERKPALDRALLDRALERCILGVSSRGRLMSETERRAVAYHEAGHALVTRALPTSGNVHRVSIIPGGHSLGATWHVDGVDRTVHTRSALIDRITVLLAGRAAEELVLGELTSNAGHDLERATGIALRMVCALGMSAALGPITVADPRLDARRQTWRTSSDEVARVVDTEVHRLIAEADARARDILTREGAALHNLAAGLLQRETLDATEVERIAAGAGAAGVPVTVAGNGHAPGAPHAG